MWAVSNGHTTVAKMLIKNGADVDTQDYDGWTALMKAVYAENTEMVKTLIANGANIHSKNIGGLTALNIAEELHGRPEIILALRDASAK